MGWLNFKFLWVGKKIKNTFRSTMSVSLSVSFVFRVKFNIPFHCQFSVSLFFLPLVHNGSLSNNPEYCYLYPTCNFLNSCLLKSYVLLFYQYICFLIVFRQSDGLCMCSAGLKVQNFQLRTEPIRLFIISNFPSSRQRRIGGVATKCRSPKNY